MIRARAAIALLLLFVCRFAFGQVANEPAMLTREQAVADFDQFWNEIAHRYIYLHNKHISWRKVRDLYRPRAVAARTRRDLLHVLEDAIAELYDDHATIGTDAPGSPRIVPSRTDLWGSWHGEKAMLDEVRPGGAAAAAGLRAGDEVLRVGGLAVAIAVARELPRTLVAPDPRACDWALRRVLAGRRGQARVVSVRHEAGEIVTVDLPERPAESSATPLESRRLAGGIGYIRFHNSLGDTALVPAFDEALTAFRAAPGIILDLRDTPGGGDNTIAEPILGRFIEREKGYQTFVVPAAWPRRTRSFVQKVQPRGPFTYSGKLVVLVDHWTASMGEGLAVGLAAMKRATIVGTPMARLNGGIYTGRLRFSHIPFNYPGERIYATDGTPRESFQPEITVPLNGSSSDDPILAFALEVVSNGLGPTGTPSGQADH